jgi:urea transport system ATP-binding protein
MLTVEGVDLYYGASHTLRQVSMTARKGEVTCILGRNGVGKTSLLRAIFGLKAIRSGKIRWEDKDISSMAPHDRARSGLALVPQGREIFPRLSVLENLMTGFAILPRAMRHIPDDIYTTFPVLKDMLSRRGGDLSGGQQQQLAIARALATKPKVLLLDEPTEGIQPSIIREMARTLKRIRDERGLSIVVSEQVLSFALDIADRVLVIENGEIVRDDVREGVDAAQISKYLSV